MIDLFLNRYATPELFIPGLARSSVLLETETQNGFRGEYLIAGRFILKQELKDEDSIVVEIFDGDESEGKLIFTQEEWDKLSEAYFKKEQWWFLQQNSKFFCTSESWWALPEVLGKEGFELIPSRTGGLFVKADQDKFLSVVGKIKRQVGATCFLQQKRIKHALSRKGG